MKKINDFKNNALKVEHVPNVFENLNSFETILKMLKNDANVLKMYFWIFNVFRYFWIFLKIYQNMGQKLGSNSLPNDLFLDFNISLSLVFEVFKD
jgi:hypothetical protein